VRFDEFRSGEDIEVERQRGPGKMQMAGNLARGEAQGGVTHEEAEDAQAGFLGECREGIDCL
jgi:hypothetical protein